MNENFALIETSTMNEVVALRSVLQEILRDMVFGRNEKVLTMLKRWTCVGHHRHTRSSYRERTDRVLLDRDDMRDAELVQHLTLSSHECTGDEHPRRNLVSST